MYSIYKIEHKTNPELIYVGSTSHFNIRKRDHKYHCNFREQKVYQMIREHGGWEQFDMVELKQIECTQLEARQEEERVRIELNAKLNSFRAVADPEYQKQYKKQNLDRISEQSKQYREKNRDRIAEKKNQKITCECGGKYTHQNKTRHMESQKHIAWSKV